MKTGPLILSIILFQLTWAGAAFGYEMVSLLTLIGLFAVLKFSQANALVITLGLGISLGFGVLMDAWLYGFNIYNFPDSKLLFYFNIPVWLLIMWAAFSATLFSSFYWALNKPTVFIVICGLLGPISYLAGREIGIIDFDNKHIFIMVFSWAAWASLFLLVWHFCVKKISI